MRACTASRGANPSYKTLYIVPVTGMSTPRRCASRCTAYNGKCRKDALPMKF